MSYGGRGALYGVCIMEDLTAVYVAGASGTPTKGGIDREREREREKGNPGAPEDRETDPRSRVQRAERIYTR